MEAMAVVLLISITMNVLDFIKNRKENKYLKNLEESNKILHAEIDKFKRDSRADRWELRRIENEIVYPVGSKILCCGNEPDSRIMIETIGGYDKHGGLLNTRGVPVVGRKYYPWLHKILQEISWDKRYALISRNEHCHLSQEDVDYKNSREYRERLM